MSLRGQDWQQFSANTLKHVEEYTVPQYGDKGVDQITNYTIEDCLKQAQKYIARYGKNARPGQQERDFLKAAHYIQVAATKYREATCGSSQT